MNKRLLLFVVVLSFLCSAIVIGAAQHSVTKRGKSANAAPILKKQRGSGRLTRSSSATGTRLRPAKQSKRMRGERQRPVRRPGGLDNHSTTPDAYGYNFVDNITPDTATYSWVELNQTGGGTVIKNPDYASSGNMFDGSDDGLFTLELGTQPIPVYAAVYASDDQHQWLYFFRS